MTATPQQVRQWSEEVAADPGSRAFLPLAEHLRSTGKVDVALRLVIRGLERHPHDVEAHHLLGLLYRDAGQLTKAFDEWDIALALAPEHHGARREIGLLCVARGEWAAAVRHLERALELDMEDEEVRLALEQAWENSRGGGKPPRRAPAPAPAAPADDFTLGNVIELPTAADLAASAETRPDAAAPAGSTASAASTAPAATAAAPAASAASAPAAPSVNGTAGEAWGGGREFDALQGEFTQLAGERGMVGAVMLDAQGYVVAGRMEVGGVDRAAEIAAVLSGASSEAERAVRHLKMGAWKGILVETEAAVVRLSPTADGGMVAVAGRREVPMGWIMRVAGRARDAAARFLAALGGGEGA